MTDRARRFHDRLELSFRSRAASAMRAGHGLPGNPDAGQNFLAAPFYIF